MRRTICPLFTKAALTSSNFSRSARNLSLVCAHVPPVMAMLYASFGAGMSFLPTRSTLRPVLSKALRMVPRVILTSAVFVVTKAVMPESITFSTPSIFFKAKLALFAAPHPPPLKDTLYPWMVDAATSSVAVGAEKATGVIAPKAHRMPNLIFAFIAR